MIKKQRRELFVQWFVWSIDNLDCDTSVWLAQYLNKRYEHNIEQRYWFAWLFANCYNLPTAWILMNEFPDFELADLNRVTDWNSKNYSRLRYETDMKYEKGKLPKKLESYSNAILSINDSQQIVFEGMVNEFTPEEGFFNVWEFVKDNFAGFGRYSTWFYLQQLKHTCNLNIEAPSLMFSDFGGSKSHRNGMLYALAMDELVDTKLTAEQYALLELEASDILEEVKDRVQVQNMKMVDRFAMETCLCSFKKIFRKDKTRWLGYYHARQADNIQKVQGDGWSGIDWDVLWQARRETLDSRLLDLRLDSVKENDFLTTGKIIQPWERFNLLDF